MKQITKLGMAAICAECLNFGINVARDYCVRREVGFDIQYSLTDSLSENGRRLFLGEDAVPRKKPAIRFKYKK